MLCAKQGGALVVIADNLILSNNRTHSDEKTIFWEGQKMDLFSLVISALSVVCGSFFLIISGSYIAYRIRKRSM